MDTLYKVTGRATKCGPVALSAIFGLPTHEAAAVIRYCRNDGRPVNGVSLNHLTLAASELAGVDLHVRAYAKSHCRGDSDRRPTLGKWLADDLPAKVPAIVCAANHFIAVLKADDGSIQVADSGAWFSRKPAKWEGVKARSRVRGCVFIDGNGSEPRKPFLPVPSKPAKRTKPAAKPKVERKVHLPDWMNRTLCGRTINGNTLVTDDGVEAATCHRCQDIYDYGYC